MSRYVVTEPASRMGSRLVRTFEFLAESPKMGRESRPRQGLRRIDEGVDAILYRERGPAIEMLSFVHGMQNLDALFED